MTPLRCLVLSFFLLCSSACAPRILLKRDFAPKVLLDDAPQPLFVGPVPYRSPLGAFALLDPGWWVADDDGRLSAELAASLQQTLVAERLVPVLVGCEAPCASAPGSLLIAARAEFIDGYAAQAPYPPSAKRVTAELRVLVVRPDGSAFYEGKYSKEVQAGVSEASRGATEEPTATLLSAAAYRALEAFVEDLRVKQDTEVFILENGGALEVGVDLLVHGDTEGAAAHFRGLVVKNPQDAAAHYDLGVALTVKGELEQARDAFAAAGRIDPHYRRELEPADRRLRDRDVLRRRAGR